MVKKEKRSRLNFIISVLVGLIIFSIFLYKAGWQALLLIWQNINFFYLLLYFLLTTFVFFLMTWRWQVIVNAYDEVSFWKLLKQTIAGYAVAYTTPSVRLGGEPLRAYMLKKEAGVDLRTGSSSVIMDKFVELTGTVIFGLVGLGLLLALPQSPMYFKLILTGLIAFTFLVLFLFYYRTVSGKGSFSSLFDFFNFGNRFDKFVKAVEDVEKKMEVFFKRYKKKFFLSFLFYLLYGLTLIVELKVLLLSFGVDVGLVAIILSLTVLGLVNFIPVPAALGFLEAGQSSLFSILEGKGEIGFALSLMLRLRALIFVALGFGLVSYFSGKQVKKKVREIEEGNQ